MDEKRLQAAMQNLDNVVSNVSLTRKEHAQLAADLDVIQTVCKAYSAARSEAKKELEEVDSPEDSDNERTD